MGMKDANLALSLFLPQVAAPCIPPSSHELVVSDSPFLPRQLTLLSFLSRSSAGDVLPLAFFFF